MRQGQHRVGSKANSSSWSVVSRLLLAASLVFIVVVVLLISLISKNSSSSSTNNESLRINWNTNTKSINSEEVKVSTSNTNNIIDISHNEETLASNIETIADNSKSDHEVDIMVVKSEAPKEPEIKLYGDAPTTHKILTLSDAMLENTPMDELMSWYGEADGGGSCSGDFGNSLVRRWRATKKPYCSAGHQLEGAGGESGIDCYLVRQTRHHGDGDNLCVMRNVMVDFSRVFGSPSDEFARPVVENYVRTQHMEQPYISYPRGFVQATGCNPIDDRWQDHNFPGWNRDWTTRAVEFVSDELQCEEWVEHRVLVTQRDTFANFFHDSEDFVNVFLALSILQWPLNNTQMYLTDLYPEGPFWDIWSKVFSPKSGLHPALTAWDLKQQFSRPRRVCFRELAVGIYGPAAPITVASWDTPCYHTALVRGYSDFVVRGLGLQQFTHYAQPQPSKTIVVTYMARKPSKEWPEKKYCDSSHSFFLCHLWAGFGSRSLGRMVSNDEEVVRRLKKHFQEGDVPARLAAKGVRKVEVQQVDYNVLSFEEQIKIDLATDVMIGPHGAGLMHNIFMRDRAALIELFVDGSSVNRHFHNLAQWFGREYSGVPVGNPVDADMLVTLLEDTIEKIPMDSY